MDLGLKDSVIAVTGGGAGIGQGISRACLTEGAHLALTREWAAELIQFGIRVNAVLPAEVLTPLYESWVGQQPGPKAALKHISEQIPLEGRMTTAAEIAAAVVFLLSPTQSGHTTAQHVIVDGGYVHLDRMLTAKASNSTRS